ncbi:gamma-butyrobetaine hydroxylase-like domain-containing protein [Variovorax sp. OV700]|uniref:gamma-butyrobetaine hydroxylase-like domain-containing protein n=1 Tax=Variovorax sp. OV700 TaxID=1882826 RepID=UPI000882D917|nr:gamma-butyrobetaine hydroxylase-like domain-containing protein [Variovorax sp. OV700]SDI17279.1 DUF971 family protein [Variovorax sp. OV700]
MAPESIVDHRARAVLEFRWADGTQHLAAYQLLRSSCPCADCKAQRAAGHDGQARLLPSAAAVRLADIRPVGAYGVQFVFGDGHDRGIFPWRFLRELLDKNRAQALASADQG